MSEKRFTINLEDECIDDAEERVFISFLDRIDFYELCGFLNEQDEKIKELTTKRDQLVQKKNRYFRLYNSVEAEVKARVDTLNKVCEYYLTEAQFKADTDPNDAVKEVINEILNTEVEI